MGRDRAGQTEEQRVDERGAERQSKIERGRDRESER